MKTDPIVEQVREIRRQIEFETHQDPELYYQRMRKLQEKFRDRLVCRRPKSLSNTARETIT
jgi:hypothetical protein